MTSQLRVFKARKIPWVFAVLKSILLFTTAGWSARPFSINFGKKWVFFHRNLPSTEKNDRIVFSIAAEKMLVLRCCCCCCCCCCCYCFCYCTIRIRSEGLIFVDVVNRAWAVCVKARGGLGAGQGISSSESAKLRCHVVVRFGLVRPEKDILLLFWHKFC